MRVAEVMRTEALHCSPRSSLQAAGRLMDQAGCGMLPVVDEEGQVVGVLTDRDVTLVLARRNQRPSDLAVLTAMSGEVAACGADDDVAAALDLMARRRVRRLPVVDRAGALQGILSLDDLVLAARPRHGATSPALEAAVAATLRAVVEHPVPALTS